MKITTITYQAVKNLGNYESERLEMSAVLEEGEDAEVAALHLRRRVNLLLVEPVNYGKPQEEPPGFLNQLAEHSPRSCCWLASGI